MSSDKVNEQLRKIFVGGLNKDVTTEESLKTQFSAWGGIIDCAVMRDRDKRSRGFGFVLFDNSACVDDIMKAKREGERFEVDGNNIEVKRALPRTEGGSSSFFSSARESRGTRKIFVGGLASSTTADDVADYFSKFGKIEDVELLKDRATGNLRGFGFVTFEDEDSADKVCAMREHSIKMKLCEVKKAESRSSMMRKRERDRDRRDDYRNRDRDRDYGSRDRDYGSRNQSYAGADGMHEKFDQ